MGQPILGRDKPFAGFVRNGNAGRAAGFQRLSAGDANIFGVCGSSAGAGIPIVRSGCVALLARAADRWREMSHHTGKGLSWGGNGKMVKIQSARARGLVERDR
jgi:hypothetical protein